MYICGGTGYLCSLVVRACLLCSHTSVCTRHRLRREPLCDQTFSCATKPQVWFLLFDPLLPPCPIPCIFTFTIPPSLPVGQSEERSDGSSSGSGAGAGPGESSVSPASDKVAPLGIRLTECLLFFINKCRL